MQNEPQSAAVAVHEVAALAGAGFALLGDLAVDHTLVDPDLTAPPVGDFSPMTLFMHDLRVAGPTAAIGCADELSCRHGGKTLGKTAVRSQAEVFGGLRMPRTSGSQARGD